MTVASVPQSSNNSVAAFLLTRQWRDFADGIQLILWFATGHGAVQVTITGQEAVFFCRQQDIAQIKATLGTKCRIGDKHFLNYQHESVVPVYFNGHKQLREATKHIRQSGLPVWEGEIRPPERYLMERFITAACIIEGELRNNTSLHPTYLNPRLRPSTERPTLKVLSIDIETSFAADQLFSIAAYSEQSAVVFMVGEVPTNSELSVIGCEDEKACLVDFFHWLNNYDPDVLIGWNFIQFDLWVLENICRRLHIDLDIGRDDKVHWRSDDNNRHYIQIPGRVALDGIEVLRGATFNFPSFALAFVAKELLGESKLIDEDDRAQEIANLYRDDKIGLAKYNLKDCELVWAIFKQAKLMEYVIERSQLTGLLMDRIGGSVAAFEYLYLPQLHRKGYVAPNLGELQSSLMSPGGYVLDSRPGIYHNVLVLDFKSLYPSIIRTFCIDPYGYWVAQHQDLPETDKVPGKRGAVFAKYDHILPTIIDTLWQARDKAKREHNQPLSQAIKIIMNSFYGVLGSPGCRFFDPRICSSITLRGHEIIQQTKQWIESEDYQVIYGDTDSVFVWVGNDRDEKSGREIGEQLAAQLNVRWHNYLDEKFAIDSALEIEFETHYLQFLMPTVRNSQEGSKKRYAGVINAKGERKLVFKGLENVRTDWTKLARQFQEEVYRRVFDNEPVEGYIRDVFERVRGGGCDDALIYRKRLRRKLADYKKNVPPHVQAARKQVEWSKINLGRGDWVEYVITTNGPEPVAHRRSPIDYQHYIDRQLAPVADSVLQFVNLSFGHITARQQDLFH